MLVERNHSRTFTLTVEGKRVATPSFVPAVSSCCAVFPVADCLRVLIELRHPRFLVSAYDLAHATKRPNARILVRIVSAASRGTALVLLDSGSYEAQCHEDRKWGITHLEKMLKMVDVDGCFAFDAYQNASHSTTRYVQETVTAIARTAGAQRRGDTIPILHGRPATLPKLAEKVYGGINPQVIAVPERDLGFGIYERATTVRKLRRCLDRLSTGIPLHILGTSHPVSIMIYSAYGADTFDGLEWSRAVIEPSTAQVQSIAQADLVRCDCRACTAPGPRSLSRIAEHNLIFYEVFMGRLRDALAENRAMDFTRNYLGGEIVGKIAHKVGRF